MRAAVWGTIALAWPLILSLLIANATATIVFYVVAMIVDVVLFWTWFSKALRYSKRASRGETFSVTSASAKAQTRGIPAKH
ncbi:MAG TPA: hypothetical protein VFH72_06915 [Candidatus Baltobacteraceae bacterium]|nr:hypothetical protein [Candidatus Baltobacteraceae bacterium]